MALAAFKSNFRPWRDFLSFHMARLKQNERISGIPRKHHHVLKEGYGNKASYIIGMIHGIGAETPSQMLLFALAISAGTAHALKLDQ